MESRINFENGLVFCTLQKNNLVDLAIKSVNLGIFKHNFINDIQICAFLKLDIDKCTNLCVN